LGFGEIADPATHRERVVLELTLICAGFDRRSRGDEAGNIVAAARSLLMRCKAGKLNSGRIRVVMFQSCNNLNHL